MNTTTLPQRTALPLPKRTPETPAPVSLPPPVDPTPVPIGDRFSVLGASVAGAQHTNQQLPNQDFMARIKTSNVSAMAVFDGCSNQENSHIGATIGGKIFLQILVAEVEKLIKANRLTRTLPIKEIQQIWAQKVRAICTLSAGAEDWSHDAEEMFYFTIVGAILTDEHSWVFHIGDGAYAVNGKIHKLSTSTGNAPAYPMYILMPGIEAEDKDKSWGSARHYPTSEIQSIVLATDGYRFLPVKITKLPTTDNNSLQGYLNSLQERKLTQEVEPLSTKESSSQDPSVFSNAVSNTVRLEVQASLSYRVVLSSGRLQDDCTIISIQRKLGARVRKTTSSTSFSAHIPGWEPAVVPKSKPVAQLSPLKTMLEKRDGRILAKIEKFLSRALTKKPDPKEE